MLDKIRHLCWQKGITVTQLENEIGVSKNSIYRWRTNMPSIDKVQKLASYFGVTTSYLLGETVDKVDVFGTAFEAIRTTKKEPTTLSDDKLNELVRLFSSASPERQQIALEILRAAESARNTRDED